MWSLQWNVRLQRMIVEAYWKECLQLYLCVHCKKTAIIIRLWMWTLQWYVQIRRMTWKAHCMKTQWFSERSSCVVEVWLRFIIGCFQEWVLLSKQMQLDDPRKRNEGKDATEEVTTDAAEGPKYGEKLLWKWLLLFKAIKISTNMVLRWFGWFHSPHLNSKNSKNHTKPPYMEPVNVLHLWEGYIAPTLS